MKPEKLIGKKVYGFKFESINVTYTPFMNDYIGKIGIIIGYDKQYKLFKVDFKERFFQYPADQIEAHLVEDEIPTLSDGVMMLVSDDNERWIEREVMGKKGMFYYYWHGNVLCKISQCKPIKKEPTKEEQLKEILGSSDKVSEIMELFKN